MPYRLITPPPKEKLQPEPEVAPEAKRTNFGRIITMVLVFVVVLSVLAYLRPLPSLTASKQPLSVPAAAAVPLAWPSYGQAAIGAAGYGVLDSHGNDTAAPMASVAKTITALSVLNKKPLKLGEQGPKITLTAKDVALYNSYYTQGGSIVPVNVGEEISEYQALQAVLLPSANNMADTLAIWAFGSLDNYTEYANQSLKKMGLSHTTIADASGFSPQTVSTAKDLVKLGEAALANPVMASIVAQEKATLPVSGQVNNTNFLLGINGLRGIKTGETDQAGGCYLFAADKDVQGHKITIIGAVMGAPNLAVALNGSRNLLLSAGRNFGLAQVAKAGQVVAHYESPWNTRTAVIAKNDLSFVAWKGSAVEIENNLKSTKPGLDKGTQVGIITASAGKFSLSSPAVLAESSDKPGWQWRLFR